ncbi:endonuclease/exonuclease/phosphatase family protein [Nocardioides sp. zg-536]|uniref:Endonuclease/exonuclease/phosphatase family protein n=1 Tax=Nocardioides faecalis TaxID=2803858 RepID=A0A938YBK1_9ACTN|nr:endonuclease/exonuclease/phosphatase family protein [Nocardioides faecalis]MBM9461340.1 endonuclease/exonuclease/phosphatase family protein [Nocardioides faecalis]QVI57610.1 endonuclease/exonuclease/phosphatase family protein [Nocardioides faecalis]
MRIVTFNILNGRTPHDDVVDPSVLADAVRSLDPDVLALQEVDRNQRRSGLADLTAVAADAMGASHQQFVAALAGSPGATWSAATGHEQPRDAAYGISLLSRLPVSGWESIRLPTLRSRVPMRFSESVRPVLVRDEPRVAIAARVATPYGELTVANTHLSFISWWNRHQLRHLLRALAPAPRPLVLCGDLNMDLARARRITGMNPLVAEATFPADAPTEQLDHVLAEPALAARGQARRMELSDHRALVVDLDLQPGLGADTARGAALGPGAGLRRLGLSRRRPAPRRTPAG